MAFLSSVGNVFQGKILSYGGKTMRLLGINYSRPFILLLILVATLGTSCNSTTSNKAESDSDRVHNSSDAGHNLLIKSTTFAWNSLIQLDQEITRELIEANSFDEMVSDINHYADKMNSIPTSNIDEDVLDFITEYHNTLRNLSAVVSDYQRSIAASNNNTSAASTASVAWDGCVDGAELIGAESRLGRIASCLAGSVITTGINSAVQESYKEQLDKEFGNEIKTLVNKLNALGVRRDELQKYLTYTYDLDDLELPIVRETNQLDNDETIQDNPTVTMPSSPLQKESEFLWLSSRKVTEADLTGKTPRELSIMRNSIYARHGRKFQTQELQNFFYVENKDIYAVNENYSDSNISRIELDNAIFIRDYQKRNNLEWP